MKIWTGVVTEKVKESKAFYTGIFGCEIVFDSDWFVLLQSGETELGFMLPNLEEQAPVFREATNGKGLWIVIDVDDVDAEYTRIKSLGVAIEFEIKDEPWGDRHFVLKDPNGIAVDVVQHG